MMQSSNIVFTNLIIYEFFKTNIVMLLKTKIIIHSIGIKYVVIIKLLVARNHIKNSINIIQKYLFIIFKTSL